MLTPLDSGANDRNQLFFSERTMPDPQSLIPLGLNAYEAAAYIALLGRPELAPADVAKQAGIPRQRVYDVLTTLSAK